jgi:hypothetical protein
MPWCCKLSLNIDSLRLIQVLLDRADSWIYFRVRVVASTCPSADGDPSDNLYNLQTFYVFNKDLARSSCGFFVLG